MSGKGSRPKPFSVSQEEYANRWDAIFGRDIKKDPIVKDDEKAMDEAFKQVEINQQINNIVNK